MPFVLPHQIAHGVSKEEADKLNEMVGNLLPATNVIPPIPLWNMPGKYSVVVFVQDKAYLPAKGSSEYPRDGPLDFPEAEEKIVVQIVEMVRDIVSRIKDQAIAEKDKRSWGKPEWIVGSTDLETYRRTADRLAQEWTAAVKEVPNFETAMGRTWETSFGRKALGCFTDVDVVRLAEADCRDDEIDRKVRYIIKDERAGDRFSYLYHKMHIDEVNRHAKTLRRFARELPTRCSFDTRLVLCVPTHRVLEYVDELRMLGLASKHNLSRSVRFDDEGIVATFLDMRYVNPINYDFAALLENLFRGKHVLSQYLFVMPSKEDAQTYDEGLDPFFRSMIKLPWFEGTIVGKRLAEEEKRSVTEANSWGVLSTPGSEIWDWGYEKVGEKDGKPIHEPARAFFHLGDTEFSHLPSISDAVVYGKLLDLLAMPNIERKEQLQVASAQKAVSRISLL
jgi:hypothetical protein